MRILTVILAVLMLASAGLAADCELEITRTACPGQEAAALKPYDGKNPTTEKIKVKDLNECLLQAQRIVNVIRKGTVATKTVTMKYEGKDPKSFFNKAPCK